MAGVSLSKPPYSGFFDFTKCLTPPKNPKNTMPVAENSLMPAASFPVATPASSSLMETLMMTLLQRQQMHLKNQQFMQLCMDPNFALLPPNTFATQASIPPACPMTPHAMPHAPATSSAPASPLKFCHVSLEEFCNFYSLDNSVASGLSRLKYTPGDRNLEKLEREDWRDDGKLSKLEWQKALDTQAQFLKDVRNGIWT